MIRCFLAIGLPEALKEELRRIQEALSGAVSGVRWVRPEGFHLTLKFFGNIPEEKLSALTRAAEKASWILRNSSFRASGSPTARKQRIMEPRQVPIP